ncbi:hypothetical protein BACPEC_01646 [[Bacteroides] pectinophilus ATCC 43243]|uniref:Uncharacterized protein n=1 Tax=[Bacteroides] pectinophilus ATCC 43243 TaxID=483218 RepID=B7ARG2_9FIRM|nr:hypothetical protein BACPEC_01646 [[Bacteroides] pectinophilus ATCC 43243]
MINIARMQYLWAFLYLQYKIINLVLLPFSYPYCIINERCCLHNRHIFVII